VRTFFGQGGRKGSSNADVRIFGAKTSNFSKFMVCLHGQGEEEVKPVRIFFGQGGGVSIFCDFVRTSSIDGPEIVDRVGK